jgi:hypothetical protein
MPTVLDWIQIAPLRAFARVRFHARTPKPARARFRGTGKPIVPVPRTATAGLPLTYSVFPRLRGRNG